MEFNGYQNFRDKLSTGNRMEEYIKGRLQEFLPGYEIVMTPQSFGCPERDTMHLCDVVVFKDGTPVLGIECKLGLQKLRVCLERYGWDGDLNTPLNESSLNKYRDCPFPFYILNGNTWCKMVMTARIDEVLQSPNEPYQTLYKDGYIYNYDCRKWHHSKSLDAELRYIINREVIC